MLRRQFFTQSTREIIKNNIFVPLASLAKGMLFAANYLLKNPGKMIASLLVISAYKTSAENPLENLRLQLATFEEPDDFKLTNDPLGNIQIDLKSIWHEALEYDSPELLQILIENANRNTDKSRSIMKFLLTQNWFLAAADGKMNILNFIYENREKYQIDIFQRNPHHYNNNDKFLKFNVPGGDALSHACVYGKINVVDYLVNKGFLNIPARQDYYFNCVYLAALHGEEFVLSRLKALGVDINNFGKIPPVFAALLRHHQNNNFSTAFFLLLKQGGNPNLIFNGISLLQAAIALDSLEGVYLLLKFKANMYQMDSSGLLPIDYAVTAKNAPIICAFCRFGYDPYTKNRDGKNLIDAIQANSKLQSVLIRNKYANYLVYLARNPQRTSVDACDYNSYNCSENAKKYYARRLATLIFWSFTLGIFPLIKLRRSPKKTNESKNIVEIKKIKKEKKPIRYINHKRVVEDDIVRLTPPKNIVIQQISEEEIQNDDPKRQREHTKKREEKSQEIQSKLIQKQREKNEQKEKLRIEKLAQQEERKRKSQLYLKEKKAAAERAAAQAKLEAQKTTLKLAPPSVRHHSIFLEPESKKPFVNFSSYAVTYARNIGVISGIDETKCDQEYRPLERLIKYLGILYNMHRCYLAISCHLSQAGKKQIYKATLAQDIRNLIVHGASEVEMQVVFDSVEQLRKVLLNDLSELKKSHSNERAVSSHNIKEINDLFGGALQKISLDALEETPLYKALASCLTRSSSTMIEQKDNQSEDQSYLEWVVKTIIPLINLIASPLIKCGMEVDIEIAYPERLDALKMLFTMCGEYFNPQRQKRLSGHSAYHFLNQCHLVRNEVGHQFPEVNFYNRLFNLCLEANKINPVIRKLNDLDISLSIRSTRECKHTICI